VNQKAYAFGIHLGTAGKIIDPDSCIVYHLGEQRVTAHQARSQLIVLGLGVSPAPVPFFEGDRIGCGGDVVALREFGSVGLIRFVTQRYADTRSLRSTLYSTFWRR
jgi:hypothetical protein